MGLSEVIGEKLKGRFGKAVRGNEIAQGNQG